MDPKSEIHATEQGALGEVRNGNIMGRTEVLNGLAEGKRCIQYLLLSILCKRILPLLPRRACSGVTLGHERSS